MDVAPVGQQGAVGAEEGVLDGVLGLLEVAEHVAAEGQQRPRVAVVDGLEGALVPATDQRDEAFVGLPPDESGCSRYGDCHPGSTAPHNACGCSRLVVCPYSRRTTLVRMPTFEHHGQRLSYTEHGSGPKITILLHGLLLSKRM